ncbi:MAG TPA: MFS transporter [Xanthobacteraceae bacterium]|nr:MFS transporter [Xanthobacteraceae bacterium]
MSIDRRRVAVALAGFSVFVNLYAPQALLPSLAREFGTSAVDTSMTITASTLAVALIAPFAGAVSDVLGRRRVIVAAMFALVVPTTMVAFSPGLHALILWRFVQGLTLPPIFAVTVAYIGEEWPPAPAIAVTGIFTSAGSIGGFAGRFIAGVVADLSNWHLAFLSLAALTLLLAVGVTALLPTERRFVRSKGFLASGRQMLRHLRNRQLVATYAVGFGVLFCFIATFTYVNFHLAEAPFRLPATWLGAIFVVYLMGSAVTPLTGRAVARFGRRRLIGGTIAVWICGLLLTLVSSLPVIVLGLAITAGCGFLCQTVSIGFVAMTAREGHSSAVGLYVTSYYIGGSAGAALPGLAWSAFGWPGCVATVVVMLLLMGLIVRHFWASPAAQKA